MFIRKEKKLKRNERTLGIIMFNYDLSRFILDREKVPDIHV